jgi:hypothetical protein
MFLVKEVNFPKMKVENSRFQYFQGKKHRKEVWMQDRHADEEQRGEAARRSSTTVPKQGLSTRRPHPTQYHISSTNHSINLLWHGGAKRQQRQCGAHQ